VAFYREDARAGTTLICGNVIDMVEVGVYIDPTDLDEGDSEHFHIFGNRIRPTTDTAIDARAGSVEAQGNGEDAGDAACTEQPAR
jgi:hypothetical protein